MPADVSDRCIKIVHDSNAHLQRQELRREVVIGGGADLRSDGSGRCIADDFYVAQITDDAWQEGLGHVTVDQEGFCSVAYRRPAQLGVGDNVRSHVEVCCGVDIHMAVAVAVDDVGHRCVGEHR